MKLKLLTTFFTLSLAVLLAACAHQPKKGDPTTQTASKAEQLQKVYADYWQVYLELHPLMATFVGVPGYNDRLPNMLSAHYRQRVHNFTANWLDKVRSIGPAGLDGQALISYKVFVYNAEDQLANEQFPGWMMPVNQFRNLAVMAAQLGSGMSAQPFKTVEDYKNWHERASRIPLLFNQAIANMREGVKAGVVEPTILMKRVVGQLDALIKDNPEKTLFWRPIANIPDSFSAAERKRITARYRDLIAHTLMPAYRALRHYITNDYMDHTRETAGLGALTNGQAWYAYEVRHNTTTDMTPAEIHRIGLEEVKRIHDEMRKVMDEVGFDGTLHEFFDYMQGNPRFTFDSKQDMLGYYRDIENRVMKGIPKLFSKTPEANLEIRPVPAFKEKTSAAAYYMGPSMDAGRPGVFYVNTYDLPTRMKWEPEDLFLHEAIPGHHFQISIQQEIKGLPTFRRFGGFTAFTEGWALYAESLGKKLGVYETPYDYFGYLQNSLWRAIRLVTDTGLHAMGWSREKVIDYMVTNSAESRTQARAEAERYMAIPGQALAYKVGAMKIHALREKARKALGEDFDIREFHSVVLGGGSVPLDILEKEIDHWIARKKN